MRRPTLLAATAIGAVLSTTSALNPRLAMADTSITLSTTTPVVTSTAGDTTVSSAGTITLTSGTAITLDSDNVLDYEGTISMAASASNSTGILITDVANRTKALTLTGDITVTDDYTASDTTSDGIVDAPWAEGSGRYGIHSIGTSPFTGDVYVTSDSAIDVEGNSSYGIRFENGITGTFTYDGATTVIGNDSTVLSLENGVTGNVYLSGSGYALGANSKVLDLKGDIGGALMIDGTYSGTGYSSTTLLSQTYLDGLDPALNLLQSGPLVTIAGNVNNGILFGAAVTSTVDDNTDEDGDGLPDTTQTTASLSQYGSAPALVIGSADNDIAVGGLTYAATAIDPPSVNYGLLVRGSIGGYGVYSGVDSTAIRLGGLGHGVTISNGIGVKGSIYASAYGANTTALSLLSGATTPQLDIDGTITATTTTATTSTTTTTNGVDVITYSTAGGGTTARAVDIATGASLGAIHLGEGAGVYASAVGSTANATAIRDQSNSLTELTNSGTLSATITASDDDVDGVSDTITGKAIAVDTRSNTVGLTLTQTDTAPDDDDIAAPYIYGRILLGSGDDHITSSGGFIYGDIDYGAGAGSLSLSDGAIYLGQVTSTGPIAVDIDSGAAAALSAGSSVQVSTLHVGADSTLGLTLNVDSPSTPVLSGTGTATFDDGGILSLTLDKINTAPTQYTVLTGSSISLGDIVASTRDGYVPYIYHAELTTNAANTALYADFRLKTQGEAGYSDNQYAAFLPVVTAAAQDSGAQYSLLAQTTKTGFDAVYNQYLPDYSGENLITLSLGAQSLTHSLGSLTVIPDNEGGQYWLQEYGYATSRPYGDTAGFDSTGFSFSGGRERAAYGNQMVGIYTSLTSSSPRDTFAIAKEITAASDLTAGGYWRINSGGLRGWAHAGVGFVQVTTTRNLLTSYVTHTATGKWNGYSLSAGAGASYGFDLGAFTVTPELTADYYRLSEAQHSETGGGDYFDLTVDGRDGHLLSSQALMKVAYTRSFVRPEAWIGYRQNLSATIGDTTASFAGGDAFTLSGGNIKGGGPVAGFRISNDNPYSYFALEAEYQKTADYTNASVSLRTRFQF